MLVACVRVCVCVYLSWLCDRVLRVVLVWRALCSVCDWCGVFMCVMCMIVC